MIHKERITINNIIDEYNSFKTKDQFWNFKNAKFEDKHERYGYYYMINNLQYAELISNEGDIHGFDGVLFKKDCVYFYEAKYSKNSSHNTLFNEAMKTILMPKKTRISPARNSKKVLILEGEIRKLKGEDAQPLDREVELLSDYLGCLRDGAKKLPIPEDRMLFAIGNEVLDKKIMPKTKEKYMSIKETLVVEYE